MDKPLRLLLVTDKDGDAAFLRAALAAGCIQRETTTAADLHAAASALAAAPYDAVLLDIALVADRPAEAVRRLRGLRDLPILIITSAAEMTATGDALAAGAQDYILWSSFNGGALAHRLQFCIERFELEREMRRRLREAERLVARFDSLVRDNADAIMVLNMNGRVKFANTAAARLFGRDAASLVGRRFSQRG